MTSTVRVVVEATPKRAFASALDWPGWSRGAKTREAALGALLAYAERYAPVAALGGASLPAGPVELDIAGETEGDASTDFGVPGRVSDPERRPMDAPEARRRADLVAAAWHHFDAIAAAAPEALRKGPRGGGRDRSRIVDHVVMSDHGYCRELGLSMPPPDPRDPASVEAMRAAMLEVLRQPSDGSPIAKRWTAAYAARRIAWHALDHAWEIEDRSEPR
ncbi:MAG: hypothetical protein HY263_07865 [Chloroflexi bacterium]|nr:hypothetical protein [Chloroflexota bacterium]